MHIRIVRLEADPSRRDQHLQEWTTKVLPALKTQPGYKGVTLLQKRETGEIISGSYFESEQAMKDAGGNVLPIAQKMLETTGGKIVSNDEYEVAVFERLQPVEAGNWVRLTTIEGDASRIEELIRRERPEITDVVVHTEPQ